MCALIPGPGSSEQKKTMQEPLLYTNNNSIARDGVEIIIKKYFNLVRWSPDGGEEILDIGCGPGDITMDLLLPNLPTNFKRVIGGDISENMVEFARKKYSHPRVEFVKLDVSADVVPADFDGKFDRIFSFYCLQMVKDHRQAFTNMYKLLKPGGSMLISYMESSPVLNTLDKLAETPKWRAYMDGVEKYKAPYENCPDSEKTARMMLCDIGFDVQLCSSVEHTYIYPNFDAFKKFARSVNPLMDKIPEELHDEHLMDIVNMQHIERDEKNQANVHYPTKLLVISAKKPF